MKKFLIIILLFTTSCSLSTERKYEVVNISHKKEIMVQYELYPCISIYPHERIYDTSGKFKVGDIVSFKLSK